MTTCKCGNADMGFDCTCEWSLSHLGDAEFTCIFCGIYSASEPRCSECESEVELISQ